MKNFFVSIFVAVLLIYAGYVLVATQPCTRVERSTMVVKLAGELVYTIAKPWASQETLARIVLYSLKWRVGMANFVQHQFYSEDRITCGWNRFDT